MDDYTIQETNEEVLRHIEDYLQRKDTQERVQERMKEARSNVMVTISHAASLFSFGEQQLRDWEIRGLLNPERPSVFDKKQSKNTVGHRRYAPSELDKLALMRELIDGGFEASEIPTTIYNMWHAIQFPAEQQGQTFVMNMQSLAVNERIENARTKLAWQYFTSRILRLSLVLIGQDVPGTTTGLLLPLGQDIDITSIHTVADLTIINEALISWLSQSRSSHTLLALKPSFEFSSDFRLQPLQVISAGIPQEEPNDNTLIILRRDAKPLSLRKDIVETIRALLKPLYEEIEHSRSCFGPSMYDMLDPAPKLDNSATYPDIILNGLADMIVRLGSDKDNQRRWQFCCILLPNDSLLPVQQRSLVVHAQSKKSPHKVGFSSVQPDTHLSSVSLRAFQSGSILYHSRISSDEQAIAFRKLEPSVQSAIAVPVGGEDGEPIAVLYVASEQQDAFSENDKRVLRIMSRIAEELLRTYSIRLHVADKLENLLLAPDTIDELFNIFLSENNFIHDIEELLKTFSVEIEKTKLYAVQQEDDSLLSSDTLSEESESEDVVSLIAIDIDDLGSFVSKYGEQMGRNLCREVGARFQEEVESKFKKYKGSRCYHIYADRFYLLLRNIPYEQVLEKAKMLKKSLDGPYKVSILRTTDTHPSLPHTKEDIPITVRLAISSYSKNTLIELLQEYSDENEFAESNIRVMMDRSLATQLKKGMDKGGDTIIAWNPKTRGHEPLSLED